MAALMARKPKPYYVSCQPDELTLGVDPGLDSGGAVWVQGETVLAALCWLRLKRKGGDVWRVRSACKSRRDSFEFATLAEALRVLPSYCKPPEYAVIEGQYLNTQRRGKARKRGPNQSDIFKVARSSGVAWLALCPSLEPLWPLGSEWRAPYGLAGLGEREAEVSAWQIAYRELCWPGALGPWLDDITTTEAGAVGEAALMAAVRRID